MKPLTAEEKATGKQNFQGAIGSDLTRREFLMGGLAAGAVSGAGLGAYYFSYGKLTQEDRVRVAVIGTGDEGNVLINAINPDYLDVVAICDIRPYNIHRAFHGDYSSPNALANRCGLIKKYGYKSEDEARKHVAEYKDYKECFRHEGLEGVIIALPLHLHDEVAIAAMQAEAGPDKKGLHVLTEKLMAHSVGQCKNMGRVSEQRQRLLATGHQRHYSILYDNAVDMIKRGLLGDLHHIRAQWHRGNLPGKDSWQLPVPSKDRNLAAMQAELEEQKAELAKSEAELAKATGSKKASLIKRLEELRKLHAQLAAQIADESVDAAKYGYGTKTLPGGKYTYSPLEELIRWRLWARTGGGLMAELGSHQLDAAGIFCTAARMIGKSDDAAKKVKKARPLSVVAVGGRHIFPEDREVDDHVYCNYEFPAPDYDPNDKELQHKKIVVSYSSINGNGFGGYGEIVMGTKGTLIIENEQDVQLYPGSSQSTSVSVAQGKDGKPTLDTTASGGGPAQAVGKLALESGPVSRGYTEELEHWAWCIRNFDFEQNQPKCKPEVAMADAIIALTSNLAIAEQKRIEFKDAWFDINSDETPEGKPPTVKPAS